MTNKQAAPGGFSEILGALSESDDILIFTHTNMDGDALGSALAL